MAVRRTAPVRDRKHEEREVGECGECAMCKPYWKQSTLTVHGQKPTLGICPNVKERKVLLSEKGCQKWQQRAQAII